MDNTQEPDYIQVILRAYIYLYLLRQNQHTKRY